MRCCSFQVDFIETKSQTSWEKNCFSFALVPWLQAQKDTARYGRRVEFAGCLFKLVLGLYVRQLVQDVVIPYFVCCRCLANFTGRKISFGVACPLLCKLLRKLRHRPCDQVILSECKNEVTLKSVYCLASMQIEQCEKTCTNNLWVFSSR